MAFIMLHLAQEVSQFLLSISVRLLVNFNLWKLTRLSGVFLPFVGHFFKRAREREIKLRHVFTKFDWSVIFSSRSKYGTFENE